MRLVDVSESQNVTDVFSDSGENIGRVYFSKTSGSWKIISRSPEQGWASKWEAAEALCRMQEIPPALEK